uniref:Outer membrane protein beta-barrel domain-containing protein n=1 Tax=viral metagenome TaxID=1070528 RepID=A0A6H1ZST8_9ZZZZ
MSGFLVTGSWSGTGVCNAQGSLYLLHQPVDIGFGVRVDYYPGVIYGFRHEKCGVYHSVSYGTLGLYRHRGLEHHIKFTTGVLVPIKPYKNVKYNITFGVSYHHLGKGSIQDLDINKELYNRWSYEVGLTFKMERFALCIVTDIPRWEPCIGIGFIF